MSATSQNGYPANNESDTQSYKIPGTNRAIRLRKGPAGALLVHFAAWFDKNVEDIEAGQLDDWGFAVRPIRGQGVEYDAHGNAINLSNHSSGTAEDLNATKHPLGKRGTFSAAKAAKIRERLKAYEGCIRWGGDYTKRADEMHFEIVKIEAACAAVLKKLTTKPAGDTGMSAAEVTEIKNFVKTETDRAIAANEASNLVWAAYVNRYGLQTEDEKERARDVFDAKIAAGGTVAEASAAMWQILAPFDAALAKSQADAR